MESTFNRFSCQQTLTGSELLSMAHQSSPAEVKVQCFYIVEHVRRNRPSKHSDTFSVIIQSQKPQMSVQHSQGEPVDFTCSLPGSANSETRCNLYFGEGSHPVQSTTTWKKRRKNKQWFCQFTVPIEDLLRYLHSEQQKEASCDYSLGSEPHSVSARSDRYSLTGWTVSRPSVSTRLTSAPGTPVNPGSGDKITGLTVGRPSTTSSSASALVTHVNPGSGLTVGKPGTTASSTSAYVTLMNPASGDKTSGLTVGRPSTTSSSASAPVTHVNPGSGLTFSKPGTTASSTSAYVILMNPASGDKTSGLTVGKPSSTFGSPSSPVTPVNPASEKQIWKLVVVVAGCGVTVGVILLGLALVCTRRGTGKFVSKRPKAKVDDDLTRDCMNMGSLNSGGVSPAGNGGTYSLITSVPDNVFPTGSVKVTRPQPQNEDSDTYHVYCTISEEPAASAQKDMVYSTLQAY
ncbi:mucin-17-like [Centroberyx affinis]|uniref:mucin-17-like n=1 Tax=Centroberyx affinis TaxID=166261 RepID=UPI003A5C0CAB